MHYLIDGHNVLNSLSEFRKLLVENHEKARELLIIKLSTLRQIRRDIQSITIVFDNKTDSHSTKIVKSGITVIYSDSEHDADDKIIKFLRESKHPQQICVFTNDNKIINHCKVYGAKYCHPKMLFHKEVKKICGRVLSDDKVSRDIIEKINKEVFDIFLRKKGSKG